uniref:Uncharacterized protein n=1 Tax=Paramoeba aestuarina TaxID=180227 RepID=A0A7S4L230_9EUKA|mmetsp:Transcript_30143/g.46732  ORF Transcript_30143/g.46732 Transcript_30143/m.46732 type:complete len:174 (+) Transcript_30143:46-567(+)
MEDQLRKRAKPLTTEEQREFVAQLEKENESTTKKFKIWITVMCIILGLLKAQTIFTHFVYGPLPHPQIFQSELEASPFNPILETFSSISFFLIAAFLANWSGKYIALSASLCCVIANAVLLLVSPSKDLFSFGWYLLINVIVITLCYYFKTIEQDTKKHIKSLEGYIYDLKSV